jgi:acyl carrier protein
MRAVWVEVLGAVDLEPDDDFFDVGGTSLSAIEVVSRIRAEFETELSIAALLEAPTIAALAKVVAPGASTS